VVFSYNDSMSAYASNAKEVTTLGNFGIAFDGSGSTPLADFSTAQRAALNSTIGGVADSLGVNRVNYIRGSRSDEGSSGNGFRVRKSLLGDIVHSEPAYVGPPSGFSLEPGFIDFEIAQASRTPIIYVGANDGMLHGFNANQGDANLGKEVMAYIPSPAVKNLNKLTSSSYSHTYYVDASPTTANACPTGCTSSSDWKTVLTSGMGAGGQGIFTLDVTSGSFTKPSTGTAAAPVLWEFTDHTDTDLGYTFGSPLVAKMNNGKWAVIFGNGYNNTVADGAASSTGHGALYIVYLSGPADTTHHVWSSTTDYVKLIAGDGTSSGTPGTASIPNGLGGPVGIDYNLDGTVDYIYAGDVYGNIWKFDVTSTSAGSWNTAFSGVPLFSARDAAGHVQPITGGLGVSFSKYGGFMLNFGTGSFIGTNDANTTSQQTLYGVLDLNDSGHTKPPVTAIGTAPNFRSANTTDSLQKQALIFVGYYTGSVATNNVSAITQQSGATDCSQTPNGGTCVTVSSDCLVNYPGLSLTSVVNTTTTSCPSALQPSSTPPVQLGWYFDLPNSAEREVADRPLIASGTADFVTSAPSGVACTGGLSGYEYILDVNTGGRLSAGAFDITGSGIANSAQQLSVGGVNYSISSRALPVGSSINTPGRFILPSSNATTGAAGTTGGAGGASVGCAGGTFVAGWGCVGVSSNGIQRAAQCTGTSDCVGLFLPGQKNRLYWRQLFTQ
jgi:type IV pilus assembly protein PilY1